MWVRTASSLWPIPSTSASSRSQEGEPPTPRTATSELVSRALMRQWILLRTRSWAKCQLRRVASPCGRSGKVQDARRPVRRFFGEQRVPSGVQCSGHDGREGKRHAAPGRWELATVSLLLCHTSSHQPEGMPTNAVYGFATVLRKILAEENPELAAAVFDAGGKTFRHDLYREYKANRPRLQTI